MADFQKGEYNVLVATSIGEEGLDIGDVDLIVCYDSHSSPIRMVSSTLWLLSFDSDFSMKVCFDA